MLTIVARYLFFSHDGFGLGHVRRNTLVARALLAREPGAEITIVTGLAVRPGWAGLGSMRFVHVPPLLKDSSGSYRTTQATFSEVLERRARTFEAVVADFAPDVVVVDRHPYGVAGELRPGLDRAARSGAALVLGLRDILDDAAIVRRELAGRGWDGAAELYDEVLTYGERVLCDHETEYGLPISPRYCGWVVERAVPTGPRPAPARGHRWRRGRRGRRLPARDRRDRGRPSAQDGARRGTVRRRGAHRRSCRGSGSGDRVRVLRNMSDCAT